MTDWIFPMTMVGVVLSIAIVAALSMWLTHRDRLACLNSGGSIIESSCIVLRGEDHG